MKYKSYLFLHHDRILFEVQDCIFVGYFCMKEYSQVWKVSYDYLLVGFKFNVEYIWSKFLWDQFRMIWFVFECFHVIVLTTKLGVSYPVPTNKLVLCTVKLGRITGIV